MSRSIDSEPEMLFLHSDVFGLCLYLIYTKFSMSHNEINKIAELVQGRMQL